ncbi:hypothetical protein ACI3PL_26585, partial [Lacticaseibacillus paracasei]
MTSDMFSQIINNYYMRPSYKQPYFFINNVNTQNSFPTEDNKLSVLPTFKVVISNFTVNSLVVKRTSSSTGITV